MYTLTWIEYGELKSISSPVYMTVLSVWFGILLKGIKGRTWIKGKLV